MKAQHLKKVKEEQDRKMEVEKELLKLEQEEANLIGMKNNNYYYNVTIKYQTK